MLTLALAMLTTAVCADDALALTAAAAAAAPAIVEAQAAPTDDGKAPSDNAASGNAASGKAPAENGSATAAAPVLPPPSDVRGEAGSNAPADLTDLAPAQEIGDAPAVPAGPPVFADLSDQQVVDKVAAYIEGVDTLKAKFTQVAPSGAVTAGEFYLRRPGLLRFEYAPPSPLLIVANQGLVYVRDNELETTDSYPVGKTPLKFLLRKKVKLGDLQIVGVERAPDEVTVRLRSTEEDAEGDIALVLAAPDLALKQWTVTDARGGKTIVILDDVVRDQKIASRLFRAPEAGGTFLKNR